MKIRVEHGDYPQSELVLYCRELDEEALAILSLLHERTAKLTAQKDGQTHLISPRELYYAEAVEGKTFLYTLEQVLEAPYSLQQLEARHGEAGLLRIGKSQLVNLYLVKALKSLPNTRIELTLQNGERLIVSRHYVQALKMRLEME